MGFYVIYDPAQRSGAACDPPAASRSATEIGPSAGHAARPATRATGESRRHGRLA